MFDLEWMIFFFTRSSSVGKRSQGISNKRNWLSSLLVKRQRPSGDLKQIYRLIDFKTSNKRKSSINDHHLQPLRKLLERFGVCVGFSNSFLKIRLGDCFFSSRTVFNINLGISALIGVRTFRFSDDSDGVFWDTHCVIICNKCGLSIELFLFPMVDIFLQAKENKNTSQCPKVWQANFAANEIIFVGFF